MTCVVTPFMAGRYSDDPSRGCHSAPNGRNPLYGGALFRPRRRRRATWAGCRNPLYGGALFRLRRMPCNRTGKRRNPLYGGALFRRGVQWQWWRRRVVTPFMAGRYSDPGRPENSRRDNRLAAFRFVIKWITRYLALGAVAHSPDFGLGAVGRRASEHGIAQGSAGLAVRGLPAKI